MAAGLGGWGWLFGGLLGGRTATPAGCLPARGARGLEGAFLMPLYLSFADTIPEDFQEFQTQNFDRLDK